MKKVSLISAVFISLLLSSQVWALTITPETLPQWTGDETSQAQINTAIFAIAGIGSDVDYKDNFGGSEEGPFAGSYETTYPGGSDPGFATITYTGGDFLTDAYLLVKDGDGPPAWYLFDLRESWDGTETLYLENFWPGNGAISHVALYGTSTPVPEPATMLLLGFGLLGLARVQRKNK